MTTAGRARTIQRVHEMMVNTILADQQRQILDAIFRNRLSAFLGARQVVGKTAAASYAALCLGLGIEWGGITIPAHDVHVISKSEKHSQDVVRRVEKLMGAFAVGVSKSRKRDDGLADSKLGSMSRIALANGRFIYAHSGKPDSIQGFPGSVLVDEIGANPNDPGDVLSQAISVTSRKAYYRALLIGNSSVRGDWWDTFWHGKSEDVVARRKEWALHTHTVHDVFPDELPAHIAQIKRAMPDRDWRRWYLCEFIDAYSRAITDLNIEASQLGGPRTSDDSMVVLCLDPGGHYNPTGMVLARVGGFALDVLKAEYWYGPLQRTEDSEKAWTKVQLERCDQLFRQYRPTRIIVDQSTYASSLGKALKRKYGAMVRLQDTTDQSRQKEWGALDALMQDGRISIPTGLDGADLRGDLVRLELDGKSRTNKVYEMGRLVLPSVTADNGSHVLHCDLAAALMLGCQYVHVEVVEAPDHGPMIPKPTGVVVEPIGVPSPSRSQNRPKRGKGSFRSQ